jgi:membrane fusion protein (multidrug efflux system)
MNKTFMLLGFCALIAHAGCTSKKEEKDNRVNFVATSPIVIDTTVTKQYVAQIRSIRHIEIRSQERGYLDKVFVDEGQYVHKGQVLFQIRPNLYLAELQKAQAEVEASNIEVQNTQALSDKNIVSPNELAMAKAKLSKARAEMALASTHLQFTKIVAPYDGFIDHLHLKLGSLVEEGELITTLSDNSEMWVYFNVPESVYLDYKANENNYNLSEVQLLMANNQVYPIAGKVETIEADFNNETGNIAFRATFPNPQNLLRNGETGNILMSVPMHHAIIIPQKASFEVMDKKYVYIIGADSCVRLTPVKVLVEMPDLFIVEGNLTAQDKLLLEGIRKVQDKDKIKFSFEEPRSVISTLNLPSE